VHLLHLPYIFQKTNYSCGAASLMAVALYYGVGYDTEEEYIHHCRSGIRKGTHSKDIVRVAESIGLSAVYKEHMTIDELIMNLAKNNPVLCAIQAWGTLEDYKKLKDGHWVVAIGFDEDKIYFEDPSLQDAKGFIFKKDFDFRWADIEPYSGGGVKHHLGIIMEYHEDVEPDDIDIVFSEIL